MKKNVFYYCLIGAIAAFGASCSSDDEVIETPPPPAPVEDPVSHFSEPANTYIVSSEGEYSFDACKPNGEIIPGIESAGWIWATKAEETSTEQELVSDVRYENGKIYFTATGNRGNAVVAAFNANNESVWVWLLWFTEQPEDKDFEGGAQFMDRFMGATSANEADGKKTWGVILYQWGRPVPLFGGYEDEWDINGETLNEAYKWTVLNPDYNYEWKVEKNNATMSESIAAPTTFFAGSNGNWLATQDPSLWEEEKTVYDPCPAGYKLPAFTDWGENFLTILEDKEDESGATYTYNGSVSYFPAGNQNREYSTGENIVGYPGFMCWNASYYFNDFLNCLGDPNCPYKTPEELIANGLAKYTPTRMNVQVIKDTAVKAVRAAANPAFAIPVRCMKIK